MSRLVSSTLYDRSPILPPQGRSPATAEQQRTPSLRNVSLAEPGGASDALLTIRLGPSFAVLDAGGDPIPLTQKKGRMMLAMLACSPGMRRSRDWLRAHLWHRSFTSHGFSSLRQCLHNLRRALGPQGGCLCADRDFIWLEETEIDFGDARSDPSLFLEDAVRIDGPAQAWLERTRDRLSRIQTSATG